MKKIFATSVIVAFIVLHGCTPAATFNKPQPEDGDAILSFPERIQGKYLSADQQVIVKITDKAITKEFDAYYREPKDSIDSSHKLVGDTLLINKTNGSKEKVVVLGDTVIHHYNETDTLFVISANGILKKSKGYYFLNTHYSDTAWEVKKLALSKGILTIGSISNENDIQKLKEITETTEDTVSTHFSLTNRQFNKFVKREGFEEQESFTRMREDNK